MSAPASNVVISAFTEDQVERLTGVSKAQLRNWDRSHFFHPSFADEDRRQAYSRIYSFKDLLSLQILGTLRNDLKISLQHLREVKEKLAHLGDDMWSKTTLYVVKKKVVFDNPETNEKEEVLTGQRILEIPLEVVRSRMETAVRKLNQRDQDEIGQVSRRRRVVQNKWVISGTRIPTRAIFDFHDAGYSVADILKEYPSLTQEDVEAAIRHETGDRSAA
ncbi:MAG: hypothetical protein A49_10140 [Methyloceanibacter sp.]|nr:MAG: hypothetical protein A49_10140 [Methyloceanibacter sp.]